MAGEAKRVHFDDEVREAILRVIDDAEEYVIFVSPYVNLWDDVTGAIKRARARHVDVSLVLIDESRSRAEWKRQKFDDLCQSLATQGVKPVPLPRSDELHAKIYLSEKTVLLSSMNLLESSLRNREFAYSVADREDAIRIRYYVHYHILKGDSPMVPPSPAAPAFASKPASSIAPRTQAAKSTTRAIKVKGFCISCCADIVLDRRFPLCAEHSARWQKRFSGNYCLKCGESAKTTKTKPLCDSCYGA